jgi:hypothetical protein
VLVIEPQPVEVVTQIVVTVDVLFRTGQGIGARPLLEGLTHHFAERSGFAKDALDGYVDCVQRRHQITFDGESPLREQLAERLLRLLHECEQGPSIFQLYDGNGFIAFRQYVNPFSRLNFDGYRRTAHRIEQSPYQPLFELSGHSASRCLRP